MSEAMILSLYMFSILSI